VINRLPGLAISLVAACAISLLSAGTASAADETETICGKNVCAQVHHNGKWVGAIFVWTPSKRKAQLRAFVGDFRRSRPDVNQAVFGVGRTFPNHKYACGGVTGGGFPVENVCIEL
jgi:hypothetical protein